MPKIWKLTRVQTKAAKTEPDEIEVDVSAVSSATETTVADVGGVTRDAVLLRFTGGGTAYVMDEDRKLVARITEEQTRASRDAARVAAELPPR